MTDDTDETREAVRQGVADGMRADREAREGYGHGTLRRAYEALHVDYDASAIRARRRNQTEGDGDDD